MVDFAEALEAGNGIDNFSIVLPCRRLRGYSQYIISGEPVAFAALIRGVERGVDARQDRHRAVRLHLAQAGPIPRPRSGSLGEDPEANGRGRGPKGPPPADSTGGGFR